MPYYITYLDKATGFLKRKEYDTYREYTDARQDFRTRGIPYNGGRFFDSKAK